MDSGAGVRTLPLVRLGYGPGVLPGLFHGRPRAAGRRKCAAVVMLGPVSTLGGHGEDVGWVNDPRRRETLAEEHVPPPVASFSVHGGDPDAYREQLRSRVLEHLRTQGFALTDSGVLAAVPDDKDALRRLHEHAVAEQRMAAAKGLWRSEDEFLGRLADPQRLKVHKIRPRLMLIENRRSADSLLWRWASLHWSVPVSAGYGRRLRFLVLDAAHRDALIGVIGLGDPVFALGCRDAWIGWSRANRQERLACILDAYVLGAVPPYSGLLGGKLVALLATSKSVRDVFARRYGHRRTLISQRDPKAKLALVTTSSALGRSSIYNRVTWPDKRLAWEPVGFTAGTGDFHLSGSLYRELVDYVSSTVPEGYTHRHERWPGEGFRNRREVLQRALEALDLPSRQLRVHGIQRQVFVAPLARNAKEFLCGADKRLDWQCLAPRELALYWRERWAVSRVEREGLPEFDPESWRLWPLRNYISFGDAQSDRRV
jgi:hypothetical protein